MQVLNFLLSFGKFIISEYCKVEVHGNMAYFTGEIKEPVARILSEASGENPSRPIQGFDRVQVPCSCRTEVIFQPDLIIFYRPPLLPGL